MSEVPDSIHGILQAVQALRESKPRIFYSELCEPNQIIVVEPDALFTNKMKVIIVNPVHRALVAEHRPDVEEFVPTGPPFGVSGSRDNGETPALR